MKLTGKSNGNERVRHISKNSRIGAEPPEVVWCRIPPPSAFFFFGGGGGGILPLSRKYSQRTRRLVFKSAQNFLLIVSSFVIHQMGAASHFTDIYRKIKKKKRWKKESLHLGLEPETSQLRLLRDQVQCEPKETKKSYILFRVID